MGLSSGFTSSGAIFKRIRNKERDRGGKVEEKDSTVEVDVCNCCFGLGLHFRIGVAGHEGLQSLSDSRIVQQLSQFGYFHLISQVGEGKKGKRKRVYRFVKDC